MIENRKQEKISIFVEYVEIQSLTVIVQQKVA